MMNIINGAYHFILLDNDFVLRQPTDTPLNQEGLIVFVYALYLRYKRTP